MISKGKKDVAVVMAAGGFMKAIHSVSGIFIFSAQIFKQCDRRGL